jgi:transposase
MLFGPDKWPDLSPIELVWEHIKNQLKKKNLLPKCADTIISGNL